MSTVASQGYGREPQVQQSNRDKPSDMVVITNVSYSLSVLTVNYYSFIIII